MEPQTIQSSVAAQLVPLANPSLIFLLVSMYGKLLFCIKIDTNTYKLFSVNYSNSSLVKYILLYIKTSFIPPLSLAKEHAFCYYDIITEKRVNHRPRKA